MINNDNTNNSKFINHGNLKIIRLSVEILRDLFITFSKK